MSGEKPIVMRTLALLGALFLAATFFAFLSFRLAGTVCHHAGAIEHKPIEGSRSPSLRSTSGPPGGVQGRVVAVPETHAERVGLSPMFPRGLRGRVHE